MGLPALEAENARAAKGEARHGWLGLAISREAAGRKLRAIDAIIVVLVGGCRDPKYFLELSWKPNRSFPGF